MQRGTPFQVKKDVYERAKAQSANKETKYFYMTAEDEADLFPEWIRFGYGLYSCMVHEEDGKYICTYMTGSTCD